MNRVERFKKWAQSNRIVSAVVIISLVVAGAAFLVEKLNVLRSVFVKQPSALDLADDLSKSQFSRDLTESAWRRLFCARMFTGRVRRQASTDQVDDAWKRYIDSTEDWNARIMINLQLLSHFYPNSDKRQQLENNIQSTWKQLEEDLVTLRYWPTESDHGHTTVEQVFKHADTLADDLNFALYTFVSGLAPPKRGG